jgi:hypothetical protein
LEFETALRWSFTRSHWTGTYRDPRKQDLVGYMFADQTIKLMIEDFSVHQADDLGVIGTDEGPATTTGKPAKKIQTQAAAKETDDDDDDQYRPDPNPWASRVDPD